MDVIFLVFHLVIGFMDVIFLVFHLVIPDK
jgi:hypothetical protein